MGVYTATEQKKHGRIVYRQDFGAKNYLFYWDWGPNNGANWVVGLNPCEWTNSKYSFWSESHFDGEVL